MQILNPLSIGTEVKMQIFRDSETFLTAGKVIYLHGQMGMGVVFLHTRLDQLEILDSWLNDLLFSAASGQIPA